MLQIEEGWLIHLCDPGPRDKMSLAMPLWFGDFSITTCLSFCDSYIFVAHSPGN